MAEPNHDGEEESETQQLLPPKPPTYLNFRHGREHGREPLRTSRCSGFVLAVFKVCFCSLGLWGHRAWNNIPRVLFMIVCMFQTIYRLFIDCGCVDFDCQGRVQNSSESKTQAHKDDVSTGNAVFTIVSIAADMSYIILICSFIVAKRMDSALVAPSETLTEDLNETAVILLCFAFVFIIATLLGMGASFYNLPSSNEMRNPTFNVAEVAGTAAQLLIHWTSINTCQVFAVSSEAIGAFAQDALRLIRDLQNSTLDDVIRIHEDLCTVVFNTVSAYSVWFVLHWLSYGAGVILTVIYISEETLKRTKYHTHTIEFVFLGLILVFALFQFVFPCVCAARITSNCAEIYEKINCTTSADWNEGHPFKERRNVTMFVSYAERRRCGFKVGRITFNTTLAWISFFFGLTGLLYNFF